MDNLYKSQQKDFEKFLKAHCESAFSSPKEKGAQTLKKALFYCLFPSSFRFRPRLCFAVAELFGKDLKDIFPWAAAIEMIHSGSLAQDDLPSMDNSDTRRGRPACHLAFGEDLALLAGSCLFVEAFSLLNTLKQPLKETHQLFRLLTQKAGFQGIMGGQALDIRRSGSSKQFFLKLYRLKTGALIEAAIEGTALLGAKKKDLSALNLFAKDLGIAYQIADDLHDKESNPLSSEKELQYFIRRALVRLQPFGKKAASLKKLVLLIDKRRRFSSSSDTLKA